MLNPKEIHNPNNFSQHHHSHSLATLKQNPPPFFSYSPPTSHAKQNKGKNTSLNPDEPVYKKTCLRPSKSLPIQFTWHQNSCAYDAFLSILYFLWYENEAWTQNFNSINPEFLGQLAQSFQ